MVLRAVVDASLCEAHGQCAPEAPDVFELDDEGYSTVAVSPIPAELRTSAEQAVRACPVGALSLVED
jgi:ferredoxin